MMKKQRGLTDSIADENEAEITVPKRVTEIGIGVFSA